MAELQGTSSSLCGSRQSLENQILAQASTTLSLAHTQISSLCASPSWAQQLSSQALQPSHLSSTNPSHQPSSSLLSSTLPSLQPSTTLLSSTNTSLLSSSSLLSSRLFSTQNHLLQSAPLLPSLASPAGPLLSAQAQPPAAREEVQGGGRGAEGESQDSEDLQTPMEVWSQVSEHSSWTDTPEESTETPVSNVYMCEEEEQVPVLKGEKFGEVEEYSSEQEEELKDKKYLLLNAVCCSLVNKEKNPGQEGWDKEDSLWMKIKSLAQHISQSDPEFLLKVALYTRQELNIRITANFLLVLAAHLPATKPHLRRYFNPAVQLPSDWLEVTRIYSTCFGRSLPSCLKKALVEKFKHFSEYQLAKYNTRKQRCKHNCTPTKPKAKKPSSQQWTKWANYLGSDPDILQKYLKAQQRAVVDKKANVFSLKKMIQRLHIRDPAEHVMPILGKRYPLDVQVFSRCGLKGAWQRERAGQRMKLDQPDTWERSLSQQGNQASTWEGLIDRKALPFMAMLRNLRNMISQGISEKHHRQILARLTNKESVIQSRQFPFRFLSAYKAILELSKSVKEVPSSKEILRGILKKVPKSKKFRKLDWETAGRRRLRVALGVPFICRTFKMKKAKLLKTSPERCTTEVLARYQQALEQAVQISCRYNVPPLPGRTLLLCDVNIGHDAEWSAKQDFCCPPDPDGDGKSDGWPETEPLTPTLQEVAVLLTMMIGFCSEHSQMLLCEGWGFKEVELKSDVLLDNVRHVMKEVKSMRRRSDTRKAYPQLLSDLVTKRAKVDTMICMMASYMDHRLQEILDKYRKDINPDTLLIKIFVSSREGMYMDPEQSTDRNCVELHGFSEQILRIVGERGSARLLDHVEHIDKLHSVPPPEGAKDQHDRDSAICSLPATPKLRWRSVRVFVSSTFRDMHGERDVLVRSVFPELRRRAAPHCLHLQEVELRWGITEEEAGRALELCLTHVCRSQLLIGILGERYGLVPPLPALPQLPQHQWLSSAPAGLSVTEMEIRQFQALHPDSAQSRMFFYFRTPQLLRSVPVAWRADFASESKDAESKMAGLKSRILQSGAKVTKDYPCEWGGAADGKPYVKGLEGFGKMVLDDLWGVLQTLFIEEVDETESGSEVTEQEMYQEAQQRQCYGRDKLVATVMKTVQAAQQKRGGARGVVLVEGGPGEGKTVFMAALANALRSPERSQKTPGCDVISYYTAASQSAQSVEQLLCCLIQWLRRRLGKGEDTPLPTSYKKLLEEFHTKLKTLSEERKNQSLALLIDGAELVQDARGQQRCEWIPQDLPLGVSLVLSVTPNSALRQTLAKMKGSSVFSLGPLSMLDRKEIVQKELAVYGKKLSDSAFNNQLQTLLMKKGSTSPLYLHLACVELRSFAVFHEMKASLQSLPQAVGPLVQQVLKRLQSQHRGLAWALGALTASDSGLRERDLYAIMTMCCEHASGKLTWQEMLKVARNPQERIPMATFSQLFQSLRSLIGQPYSQGPEDCLTLTNPEVRSAFEQLYLSGADDRARAHSLLAAHLWTLSDPEGKDTFFHCEPDAVIHLPAHLMSCGETAAVKFLLSSFHFLYANVRHGLLHHLLEAYSQFESSMASATLGDLEECRSFLKRHASLFSHWPALFLQQALNEPDGSAPHVWARGIVGNRQKGGAGSVCVMRWLNKPEHTCTGDSELVSSYLSKPTCVAVSPGKAITAVGTENGSLHLIHGETGQEVQSLVSCCDGISGCCFLGEGLLASTSFDGQLEVWDIESGCRTTRVDAHSNRITGCDVSGDKKHLATVSLDLNLKVWSAGGALVTTLAHPCPLNCVTFDPEGQVLAVGGWDGGVHLWNWLRGETLGTLSGHQQSVRSLSFSPSISLLSSGSLSGEVRLWAVPALSCVGCYCAHQGSTDVLNFVQGGELLLSAGADGVVQVWSGSLGQEMAVLRQDKNQLDSHLLATEEPPALCVAVSGSYAAVGYHGAGVKLYSVESGEGLWSSVDLRQSVHSLIWIQETKSKESGVGPGGQAQEAVESGEQVQPEEEMEVESGEEVESQEETGSGTGVGPRGQAETGVESGEQAEPGAEMEAGSAEDEESAEETGSEEEAEPRAEMEAGSGEEEESAEETGSDEEAEPGSEMEAGSAEEEESAEETGSDEEAEPRAEMEAGSAEEKSAEEEESAEETGSGEEAEPGVGEGIEAESGEEVEPEAEMGVESVEEAGSGEEVGSADEAGSGGEAGSETGQSGETETRAEPGTGQEGETESDFLVTGGGDSLLRVWKRQGEGQMEPRGSFGVQQGPILSLAQSSSYLASASEDCTIVLWSVQDLTSDPWCDPSPVSVLRGHRGGVTCLSFSSSGEELLSGGKDRALLLWRLQPPSLSQSLLHSHRDWITGCAWTPADSTVVSCSADGRVCVWELQKGSCLREIPTPLSLTSLCCRGEHVIGGSREGHLLLWEWQSGVEVSRIPAHRAPILHCSTLPNTDKENLVVATASDDGTVKLWRPYDVHHHSTVTGHSGGIQGLAARLEGVPSFLTISEDCSLRSCSVSMAMAPKNLKLDPEPVLRYLMMGPETPRWGATTALAFSSCGRLLLSGFTSGRVQVWRDNSLLCSKKVADSEVTALTCMPDGQFAVGCADCTVSVWRLDCNPQHPTAQLHKVSSNTVESPVKFLDFCSILLGVCEDGLILNLLKSGNDYTDRIYRWTNDLRVLRLKPNNDISIWLLGESDWEVQLAFTFSMGNTDLSSSFGYTRLTENESPSETRKKTLITAATIDTDFVVCGDNKGNIWFNQPPNRCSWSEKKPAHSGRVSVLRLTESTIISASYDRTVKLWDRQTKRQVGVFVCGGPVLTLEVNPLRPTELVCGDSLGGLYFLSWGD